MVELSEARSGCHSPKRFYQQGPDLEDVRKALKEDTVPRGLEGLLGS